MLSHKIKLSPNNKQITYFKKACGTSRFVYNRALEKWEEQYKSGNKPSSFGLKNRNSLGYMRLLKQQG